MRQPIIKYGLGEGLVESADRGAAPEKVPSMKKN
jgi:hypothetical protein